jgi:membrane protease YdiL (CAAX protease family)
MLGWKFNNFKIWHTIVVVVEIFALAGILTSYFGETDNELLRILRSSRTAVILIAILATFTAPIVEEVVYRGVLYSALQRTVGVWMAVFLVTLLFAVVHVPQYLPDYVAISMICLLSLILTLVRVWTKNLLPCIVLHFVFNGIQSVFLVLEPYLPKVP